MPLPTTRAYVSDTDADDYFIHTLRGAEWGALSLTQKTLALNEATRWLEGLCYYGEKCSSTQTFQWPRKLDATDCCEAAVCTTLPPKMVEATCELALALHNNQTTLITTTSTTQAGIFTKRQKLGDLEVEFDQFAPGAPGAASSASSGPYLVQKFPWLKPILRCYAEVGASNLMLRVRS